MVGISPSSEPSWDKRSESERGIPPLATLYFYATGSCNLPCRHCWITPRFDAGERPGSFLRLDHAEKALRQALPLGLSSAKLTGGEPTLHPAFRELVSMIAGFGVSIWIETNGTLMDLTLAKFLQATGKVTNVSVSLDGATRATHEALRMVPGSFDRAVAGVRALVDASFRPQVIFTLHRGNLEEVEAFLSMAERLGCGSVKFNVLMEVGRGETFSRQEGLSVSEILTFGKHLEGELVRDRSMQVYLDVPIAFRPIGRLLRDHGSRCTVLNILGVLPTGQVSVCGVGSFVPELIYGDLETDDLASVWSGSPGLLALRRLIPERLEGVCSACIHRDSCLGSCVASNYFSTGRLEAAFSFCEGADEIGLFPASRKH